MDTKTTGMVAKGVQWVIAILGIVFIIMIFSGKDAGVDGGLYLTYAAIALAIGMAVLASIIGLVTAGKRAIPTLIGFGVFVVLFGIAYAIASDEVLTSWREMGVTPGTSKWVGAGLGVFYIMLGGAIVAILAGEVTRFFK